MNQNDRERDSRIPPLRARPGTFRTVVVGVALILTGALAVYSWPAALEAVRGPIAEIGWLRVVTAPATVLFILLLFGEIGVLILLAQSTVTAEEQNWANWIVFILLSLGAIITEIVTALGFAPLTFGISLLIILGSLLVILGTAIWLWQTGFIGLRRNICALLVPYYFEFPKMGV